MVLYRGDGGAFRGLSGFGPAFEVGVFDIGVTRRVFQARGCLVFVVVRPDPPPTGDTVAGGVVFAT